MGASHRGVRRALCLFLPVSPFLVKDVHARPEVEDDGALVGLREHGSQETLAFSALHDQLWSGEDYAAFEAAFNAEVERLVQAKAVRSATHLSNAEANIHVLGIQNSGTNLLQSMLLMNFGYRFNYFDLSWDKNLTEKGALRHGIWKHSNLAETCAKDPEVFERLRSWNVVPLMMVRNGVSWLQSMRKAGYELTPCVTGKDWLTRPCYHRVPGGYRSHAKPETFDNVEEIWNQWTQAYTEVGTSDSCFGKKGMVVHYEELVLRPEQVMDRIAKYIGVAPPPTWRIRDEAAKMHGHALGREEAVDKIRQQLYLNAYRNGQLSVACERLNRTTLEMHGYNDCMLDPTDSSQKAVDSKALDKHQRLRAHAGKKHAQSKRLSKRHF